MREALGGVLVEPRVGPFTDGGLHEPFGLAVGARHVDARADRHFTQRKRFILSLLGKPGRGSLRVLEHKECP